jgi:hypothetical protein
MKKTEAELKANYEKFIAIVNKYFTGDRLSKLLFMYSDDELGGNLMVSPASGNKNYHNAYEGGYIDHIFNVCKNALKMKDLFIAQGGTQDFTDEELIFCALHHDLGKLGTKQHLHYIPNDSDWHIKNRGDVFMKNPSNQYMTLTDRTFFTLQDYGIKINENEYFGIKLTDGMYDEDNQKYLKTFNKDNVQKSAIARIMHWADHMSTVIEQSHNKSQKNDKFSLNVGQF